MAPTDHVPDRSSEPSTDPWSAFGSLGAGVLLYGGLGWAGDRWLGTSFLLPVGLVLGAVLGFYVVIVRFGRAPEEPEQTPERDT